MQDVNLNQLKLKVNDTYGHYENITKLEPRIKVNNANKAYLDTELDNVEGHIAFLEKGF